MERRDPAEVTASLIEIIPAFNTAAGERLARAMNNAFPYANVEPSDEDYAGLADVELPDEDDRHVLAAAIAAEATVLHVECLGLPAGCR